MKPVSGRQLIRTLEQQGWSVARINGNHHILVKPGSPLRLSVPVHGARPLKAGLQHHLMKQANLSEDML